jgi:tetratricopeptide (TPR) repeat protein
MTSSVLHLCLGGRSHLRSLFAVVLALSLVTVGVVPVPAYAAKDSAEKKRDRKEKDPREMQAREAYAAGNYKEALEIYTKLYAEQLHPTYLRNIGRCYQNLQDPDHAISSFREYLRKAKDMPADERTEVEGYIKEMVELQKQNATAAESAKPVPQPVPVVAPQPVQPALVVQDQPAPAPEPDPFYKKGWFWGVVAGVVVAGTVAGLAAGGVFSSKSNNGCPKGVTCTAP